MQERVPDRNGPETATEEELAWLSRMEAIKGRVQAQDRRLEAASQTLQATLTGLESDTSKLEGEAEMWKNHRLVWHGGEPASYGVQEGIGLHKSTPSSCAAFTLALHITICGRRTTTSVSTS